MFNDTMQSVQKESFEKSQSREVVLTKKITQMTQEMA